MFSEAVPRQVKTGYSIHWTGSGGRSPKPSYFVSKDCSEATFQSKGEEVLSNLTCWVSRRFMRKHEKYKVARNNSPVFVEVKAGG